jgi:hypothetical protein
MSVSVNCTLLSLTQTENYHDICEIPHSIQAQTVSSLQTNVNYTVSWKTINGLIITFISRTSGIDFPIRFCCMNRDFIPTKLPRPIDDNTCGRTQIKASFQLKRIFGGTRAIPHSWPWVSVIISPSPSPSICVGEILSGDSACQADSGSPLLQQYHGQWFVQDVASYIDDCKTNEDFPPNVYVKVSTYFNGIYSILLIRYKKTKFCFDENKFSNAIIYLFTI